MNIISLSAPIAGNACAVALYIKSYIYNYNRETNFFDFLVCSIKSINDVITNKKIEVGQIISNDIFCSILFKNFDLLISHHDLEVDNENNIEKINNVVEKYQRRQERLFNYIKNSNKIFFIRYCDKTENIEKNEITNFYKNIKNINNKLLFYFILITNNNDLIVPKELFSKKNFLFINLNKHSNDNIIDKDINPFFQIIESYKPLSNIIYDKLNNIEKINLKNKSKKIINSF